MQQIRFRLGLCPRPAGELTAPPDPLIGFEGVLLLREGNGREEDGEGRKGRGKDASWLLGMDALAKQRDIQGPSHKIGMIGSGTIHLAPKTGAYSLNIIQAFFQEMIVNFVF